MSSASSAPGIVSFEDARRIVKEHATKVPEAQSGPAQTEVVDLLKGQGRILAEAIVADRDFPPFPRATRDGYAVRTADVEKTPARLAMMGEIKAGDLPDRLTVDPGQAVSIMTGAALPPGADAVVMVEYTTADGQFVEVQRRVSVHENFVPRGAEARAGQMLLDRGRRLNHAAIAIAASVGKSRVEVFRKPRVAVLSTGDEVVGIDAAPGPAQIRNSNSYSLAAQIEAAGGQPVRLAIAPDEPRQLRALIDEGLGHDLLLLTGGVSMGKYDLVEQVLAELNAEFYFTGAKIQPGKPVVFGSCDADIPVRAPATNPLSAEAVPAAPRKKYFFGLPGNPVSTMVTFELFVRPMIEALAGMAPQPLIFPRARLKSEIRTKTGLKRFLPAVLSGNFENAEVELARWLGSGDIAALAATNCYIVIPPDREKIEAGEWVPLLMRYPVHNG